MILFKSVCSHQVGRNLRLRWQGLQNKRLEYWMRYIRVQVYFYFKMLSFFRSHCDSSCPRHHAKRAWDNALQVNSLQEHQEHTHRIVLVLVRTYVNTSAIPNVWFKVFLVYLCHWWMQPHKIEDLQTTHRHASIWLYWLRSLFAIAVPPQNQVEPI